MLTSRPVRPMRELPAWNGAARPAQPSGISREASGSSAKPVTRKLLPLAWPRRSLALRSPRSIPVTILAIYFEPPSLASAPCTCREPRRFRGLERAQDQRQAPAFGRRARFARVGEIALEVGRELLRLEVDFAAAVAPARRQRAVAA